MASIGREGREVSAVRPSLFSHCKNLLGYNLLQENPHREVCELLQEQTAHLFWPVKERKNSSFTMLLIPRDCFKTTIGGVGLCTYLLGEDPNLTGLISGHIHEHSMDILSACRQQFESPKFTKRYGDLRVNPVLEQQSRRWNMTGLTLARGKNMVTTTPSLATTGVNRSKTGGHYDFIIADDLHSELNTSSPNGIARVKRHFTALQPLLKPGGALIVIGTRWSVHDLYGEILSKDEARVRQEQEPMYRTVVESAIRPDGSLYFKERLSFEYLAEKKAGMPLSDFDKWYMNMPRSERDIVFQPKFFQFYDGDISYMSDTPVLVVEPSVSREYAPLMPRRIA